MVIHNKQMLENFKDKKGKINIAVFSDIYKPFVGGVTTVIEDMMQNLQKECNIVLFCQGQRKNKDYDNFPIIRCKTIPFFKSVGDIPIPKLDRKLEKTFKDLKIDVIHIHTFFGLASFALKMAKKYKIPVVYHGHTKLYDEYMSITNNKIVSKILTKRAVKKLNKATEVWTVSEGTKKLYQSFGINVPIEVVRNTTKFDYLDNKKFVDEIKNKYNLHSNNIVLFMSRISIKTKNIDFLLKSCQKAMHKLDNFQLVIVGGGEDYDLTVKLAKDLDLYKSCVFTGVIKDTETREAFYQMAKLFVFPSVCDTAGIVILEAASQKTPTLCIQGTFPAEIITDEKNGYLSPLDENIFAEKIVQILNSQNLSQVGENAYKELLNKDVYKWIFERYKKLT